MSGNKRFMNCSKASLPFAFDPSAVLLEETGNTTSLSNLGWPDTITDDFHAFGMTSRSMGPFYCIGAGVAGLAIVGRLWWTIRRGPRQSVVELVLLLVGFFPRGVIRMVIAIDNDLVGIRHARNLLDYCHSYRVPICRAGQ